MSNQNQPSQSRWYNQHQHQQPQRVLVPELPQMAEPTVEMPRILVELMVPGTHFDTRKSVRWTRNFNEFLLQVVREYSGHIFKVGIYPIGIPVNAQTMKIISAYDGREIFDDKSLDSVLTEVIKNPNADACFIEAQPIMVHNKQQQQANRNAQAPPNSENPEVFYNWPAGGGFEKFSLS